MFADGSPLDAGDGPHIECSWDSRREYNPERNGLSSEDLAGDVSAVAPDTCRQMVPNSSFATARAYQQQRSQRKPLTKSRSEERLPPNEEAEEPSLRAD